MKLILAGLLLCCAQALQAQSVSGSILGNVKDPGAMAVGGATITLTQTATGAGREAKSNQKGGFVFTNLAPGEYQLTVKHTGFKTASLRSIVLTASETLSLGDIALAVGDVTESVTVSEHVAAVQTASSERAGVVTSDQIENLLVRGRNVLSLMQLLPGVVDLNDSDTLDRNFNINVQGNRNNTTNIAIDGMTVTDIGNNVVGVVSLGMDAVAEVKVLLSNFQAEYGRMSGANVQMVTKSGTRQFHGIASYFKRHEEFNANSFFNNQLGLQKPRARYNTWNFNIGGPAFIPKVWNRDKNKLFFFWSQEYWPRQVSLPIGQLTVPNELERTGDFSQTLDLNNRVIAINDPQTRQVYPGNKIPASLVDPNGRALLSVFPLPNFTNRAISAGRYNYLYQTNLNTSQKLNTLKLDYNLHPRNSFAVTYTHHTDSQTGAMGLATTSANWPQFTRTFISFGSVVSARDTHIFSPTFVNEFRFGYSQRPEEERVPDSEYRRNQRDAIGFKAGQLYSAANPQGYIPNATFGGVTSPANLNLENRTPLSQNQDTINIAESISKTFTNHLAKAGLFINRNNRGAQLPVIFNGTYDFARNASNPLDAGYAYANAAVGVFNSYTEASIRPDVSVDINSVEWFVQDNWRVHRRLTLELGVRFAYMSPQSERRNQMAGFIPTLYDQAKRVQLIRPAIIGGQRVGVHPVTGKTYPAALIGAIAPGVGDPANGMVLGTKDPDHPGTLIGNTGVNSGPRVGFAWDPFGKGKTAFRGGAGLFYNLQDFQLLRLLGAQPPLVSNPTLYYGTFNDLLSAPGFTFPQTVLGVGRNAHIPMVMNMSISIQQNIGYGTVVDVGYTGSLARHLLWQRELNSVPYGANFNPANADPTNTRVPLSVAFLRPIAGYNSVGMREWASSSNYHSLQVTANRRFARGVQFGSAWTWSRALDINDGDFTAVSSLLPIRMRYYGLANFDRTHILKLNYLWDIPKAHWRAAPLRVALNGWQISGITSFVSGAPASVSFSTTAGTDITGSPSDAARIDVLSNPNLPKGDRTFSHNFRTGVFRVPALGTPGNAAKTLVRGPGINNWDLAMFKNFPIREPFRLQLRWETYNSFNHTQFSAFDTAARFDATGAQVNTRLSEYTAARNPRTMQFSLRFYF